MHASLLPFVIAVISQVGFQYPPVQLDDPIHNPIEDIAIVGYDEHGPIKAFQGILQDFRRGDVEVVGRFIQQQEIRPGDHQQGHLKPAPLPAGQVPDRPARLLVGEKEAAEQRHGVEGQVEGGFQQGMGFALTEEIQFDQETGACLTGDFLDYKMPTAVEMPRRIKSIFIESNEPTGPFGAKSMSEPCVSVPAPAIANAIYNAVGVRVRELPITPEKILAGLGKL